MNRVEYAKTLFLPAPLPCVTATIVVLYRPAGEDPVAFLQQSVM